MTEFKPAVTSAKASPKSKRSGGYAGVDNGDVKKMGEISALQTSKIITTIGELDRVFDGGITLGSVSLLSGDPGAGKTTLLSQLIAILSFKFPVMYATAEESLGMYKARSEDRLKLKHNEDNLFLLAEHNVNAILDHAAKKKVKFLIVDSIQSVESEHYSGSAGGVSQVKGCAQDINRFCKIHGITCILVGHVTKGENMAGPQVLKHIIDGHFHVSVADSGIRSIRPTKHRFGDTDRVGIFQMVEKGMVSVDDPSRLFLAGMESSGSAITCIRDGSRNLLLEIQSLVDDCDGDHPQRVSIGLSANRLKMITAILKRHGGIKLRHDIFISLVGGMRIPDTDTSTDLALAASLYSSIKGNVIPRNTCFMGELSLSGEVRPVAGGVQRVSEAASHGFTRIFVPKANYSPKMEREGLQVVKVQSVGDLIKELR